MAKINNILFIIPFIIRSMHTRTRAPTHMHADRDPLSFSAATNPLLKRTKIQLISPFRLHCPISKQILIGYFEHSYNSVHMDAHTTNSHQLSRATTKICHSPSECNSGFGCTCKLLMNSLNRENWTTIDTKTLPYRSNLVESQVT